MGAEANATELLRAIGEGDRRAADELLAVVYEELRGLAARYLRQERAGHTLQPTALVHEAYVRLVGGAQPDWQGRAHFLAVAARAMRNALVNHALARKAEKRGGGRTAVSLEAGLIARPAAELDAIELSEAIERLSALDERKARLIEMRFFAGMTMDECASALGVSLSTAEADWRFARAWLARALAEDEAAGGES
ncbi:MAG: sigma-70 family RNA polymerase sigma factor [Phycisphaeraceae bacterium]|nr:sigma-70 family RNA polymerase sigma factor [Phycisphaeraceae bacterium]